MSYRILAGEEISNVSLTPSNRDEMLHNVGSVMQFMRERGIRMHKTTAEGTIFAGFVAATQRFI